MLRTILKPVFFVRGFRVVDPKQELARLRSEKPVMVISNHAAFIDSVYYILGLPSRLTICGAKPRLFSTAFRRTLMALANVIEVADKEGFLADTNRLLACGENILVYPEMGRRAAGLGLFETWAAETALTTSVLILPCYIYGTTEGQPGPPRLLVGEPLTPTGDAQTLTAEMRRAIETLEATTQ